MGGDHCAIVTCPANNTNNRGLTFHRLPAQAVNDEWRNQLIQKINRIDKGFNARTAHICSRHFRDSCYKTGPAGITAKRRRLIPGSLPTEYMPVRTVETPRVPERKPPTQREPPLAVKKVCCLTLQDVRKDVTRLPSPWILLENEQQNISFGIVDKSAVKIYVAISFDLCSSVTVMGMPVPHLNRNLEGLRLKDYLSQLTVLNVCQGVKSQQVLEFAKLPADTTAKDSYFLHISYQFANGNPCNTSCVRSKECHVLSEADVCIKCQETEKKLSAKQTQSQENIQVPLKLNDPLHAMSTKKLKVALKCVHQQEKKLRQKLEST